MTHAQDLFKLPLKAKISPGIYWTTEKKKKNKSLRQVFHPREVLLLTIVLMEPNEVIAWRRKDVSASKFRMEDSSGLSVRLPSLKK